MLNIDGSNLIIPAIALRNGGYSNATMLDLTPHQGGYVRVYLSEVGEVQVNPSVVTYWQLAQVFLPYPSSPMVEAGEDPAPPPPLDLAALDVTFFPLPNPNE